MLIIHFFFSFIHKVVFNLKINYFRHIFLKLKMAKKLINLLLFFLIVFELNGQVISPFNIRYQVQQKGGIVFVSNTSVSCDVLGCAGSAQVPPGGGAADNDYRNRYVDFDGDPTTFSSSSDSLTLPNCSQISFAGLYWGGESRAGSNNYAIRNQCKIKIDGGAYLDLTADTITNNNVGFNTYHCFKEITGLVQGAGINNRYTVANVQCDTAGTNRFGGWTIVIVYKNDVKTMKTLTVFNGLSNVSAANPATNVTVAGFLTPLTGPINFELGHLTYDGDRGSTGDRLRFNGAGTFRDCFDARNPATDVMNSTLSSAIWQTRTV